MTDVTCILSAVGARDPSAAERLLPLVYDELRRLAAARMAMETPGQTLQATALVHEAYVRLVDTNTPQHWENRGHFFAAAAEAMRRILVENARRKKAIRHGGEYQRREMLDDDVVVIDPSDDELLDLDAALSRLAKLEPRSAQLANLRLFAGMTLEETAVILGVSPSTAKREWTYVRAWLRREMNKNGIS